MDIRPVKNEGDYRLALKRLEIIIDAAANSPEGEEAEILPLLIDNYDNEHFAIEGNIN